MVRDIRKGSDDRLPILCNVEIHIQILQVVGPWQEGDCFLLPWVVNPKTSSRSDARLVPARSAAALVQAIGLASPPGLDLAFLGLECTGGMSLGLHEQNLLRHATHAVQLHVFDNIINSSQSELYVCWWLLRRSNPFRRMKRRQEDIFPESSCCVFVRDLSIVV